MNKILHQDIPVAFYRHFIQHTCHQRDYFFPLALLRRAIKFGEQPVQVVCAFCFLAFFFAFVGNKQISSGSVNK